MKLCKHNNGVGFCDITKSYCVEAPCENEELIEYVPLQRGEWKPAIDYPWLLDCSLCGFSKEYGINYCPNCGAKMGEEQTDE